MKHIFIPSGGLANRVRVILSALQWQKDYGQKVSIWWHANPDLACRFEDIYMPVKEISEVGKTQGYLFRLVKKLSKNVRQMVNSSQFMITSKELI